MNAQLEKIRRSYRLQAYVGVGLASVVVAAVTWKIATGNQPAFLLAAALLWAGVGAWALVLRRAYVKLDMDTARQHGLIKDDV